MKLEATGASLEPEPKNIDSSIHQAFSILKTANDPTFLLEEEDVPFILTTLAKRGWNVIPPLVEWFSDEQKEGKVLLVSTLILLFFNEQKTRNKDSIHADSSSKRQLMQRLALILDVSWKRIELLGLGTHVSRSQNGLFSCLLANQYPECWQYILDTIDVGNATTVEGYILNATERQRSDIDDCAISWLLEARLVSDFTIILPDSFFSSKVINEAAESIGMEKRLPKNSHLGGVTLQRQRIALLPKSASANVVRHERNHLKYPGLQVGVFGSSLNEAITERIARDEAPLVESFIERMVEEFSFSLRKEEAYPAEVALLGKLHERYPAVYGLMKLAYKEGTVASITNFIQIALEQMGVQQFLSLFLAAPIPSKTDKYRIRISTHDATEQISRESEPTTMMSFKQKIIQRMRK